MLKYIKNVEKIINNEALYQSGKVGTDGYFVTFNDSIDIPSSVLRETGTEIQLCLNDFKMFVRKNIVDTTQACDILECSRQNIAYMVSQKQIVPVKEEVRGNLYTKGEILRRSW